MPPIAQHSFQKLLFYQGMAAMEWPFRNRPPLNRAALSSIRNFLFLQYDTPLGSAVHATPMYEAIKRAMPDAHISVAASRMMSSVVAHNPFVDRCVVTPDPWTDFSGAVRAVREMYQEFPAGGACLVTTLGNQRSRLAFLAMRAAGSAVRAGFMLAGPMYDLPLKTRADRSQIDQNLEILRTLGHKIGKLEPRIFFQQEDADYAAHLLRKTGYDAARPRIAYVTQNSGAQPNFWRTERFQQVISALSFALHSHPVFVGSSHEVERIAVLRDPLSEQGTMVAGKTTIPQLAAVLAQCDAVVSLDTGTFHVARAVGLPGVVIAPGWQNPIEWLPVGDPRYRVLWRASSDESMARKYIDAISTEQVMDAAKELLLPISLSPGAFAEARAARVRAASRG